MKALLYQHLVIDPCKAVIAPAYYSPNSQLLWYELYKLFGRDIIIVGYWITINNNSQILLTKQVADWAAASEIGLKKVLIVFKAAPDGQICALMREEA